MSTPANLVVHGPTTSPAALTGLQDLARRRLIEGSFFQIVAVAGPQHATRYTCAGRIRDTSDGATIETIAHGTGSRSAKRAAAAELLRSLPVRGSRAVAHLDADAVVNNGAS